jgi:uncharacterized membrane protein YvbJ
MAICRHCGAQVKPDKAFCFNCGAPMYANTVETNDEPPPEFADTISTSDPAPDPAPPATVAVVEQPQAVMGSETSQTELASDATANTSTRRGFLSRRVWIVIALLLLLVVLGVIAWTILAD